MQRKCSSISFRNHTVLSPPRERGDKPGSVDNHVLTIIPADINLRDCPSWFSLGGKSIPGAKLCAGLSGSATSLRRQAVQPPGTESPSRSGNLGLALAGRSGHALEGTELWPLGRCHRGVWMLWRLCSIQHNRKCTFGFPGLPSCPRKRGSPLQAAAAAPPKT